MLRFHPTRNPKTGRSADSFAAMRSTTLMVVTFVGTDQCRAGSTRPRRPAPCPGRRQQPSDRSPLPWAPSMSGTGRRGHWRRCSSVGPCRCPPRSPAPSHGTTSPTLLRGGGRRTQCPSGGRTPASVTAASELADSRSGGRRLEGNCSCVAKSIESRTRNAGRAASDQQERLRPRPELSPSTIVSDNLRRSVVRIIITAHILSVNYLFSGWRCVVLWGARRGNRVHALLWLIALCSSAIRPS